MRLLQESDRDVSGSTNKLARGAGSALLVIAGARALRFVLQLVLSRMLGAADYGVFTLLMAITYLGSMFSAFGFPIAIVRFGAAYRVAADHGRLSLLVRNSLLAIFVLGLVVATCLMLASDYLSGALSLGVDGGRLLVVCIWSVLFINVGVWAAGLLRSQSKAAAASMLQEFIPTLSRAIMISLAVMTGAGLWGAVWGHFTAVLLVAVIGGMAVRPELKSLPIPGVKKITLGLSGLSPNMPQLLKVSAPLMLSGLTYTTLLYADRFMIAYFMEDIASVGVYSAAATIAMQMSVAMMAGNMIFAPMITAAFEEGDKDKMMRLLQRTTWWVTLLAVPIAIVIAMNARLLMNLFGLVFVQGATALVVLAAAQLYNMVTGPIGIVLQMSGRQNLDLVINLFLVIVNVALNIVLIPRFGLEGAAIATLISMLAVHTVRVVIVWKLYQLWSVTPRQLAVACAGFSVLGIGLFIGPIPVWMALSGTLALIVAGTGLVLRLGLDDEDRGVIRMLGRRLGES